MGLALAHARNDIKVLFFIVNFFVGLLPGFFSVAVFFAGLFGLTSFGVGPWVLIPGVVGSMVLAFTALGYAGAIKQNRKMLFAYSGTMVLIAVVDVVLLAVIHGGRLELLNALPLMHIGLTVLAGALAYILAQTARRAAEEGCVFRPDPDSC